MFDIQDENRRIVSLLPAATEILCHLGLADQLVGVSHQCRRTALLSDKPTVTFSAIPAAVTSGEIDAVVRHQIAQGQPLYGIDEALLGALRPDLIITQAQCDICAVRYDDVVTAARNIAPEGAVRVLSLQPATLNDILKDVQRVGEAAGVPGRAEQCVGQLRARIDHVHCRTEALTLAERPRVTLIEWLDPLMIGANWTPDLVALAGGEYALAQSGRHSVCVPWETVRQYNPQVLLVAVCGFDLNRTLSEARQLQQLPGFSDIAAVTEGRVWVLDGDVHFNCPSPGVVDTLELLAQLLHPQRVPGPATVRAATWRRFGSN